MKLLTLLGILFGLFLGSAYAQLDESAIEDLCVEEVESRGGVEDPLCTHRTEGSEPIACFEEIRVTCVDHRGKASTTHYRSFTRECKATQLECL